MILTDIPHMNAGSEHQGYHWVPGDNIEHAAGRWKPDEVN